MMDDMIRGLPVYTESGTALGKVRNIAVDVSSHAIVQYHVVRSRRLRDPLPRELRIAPSQVISVDETCMRVRDSAVADSVTAELMKDMTMPEPATASGGAAARTIHHN